ncbi:MAG: Sulphatase-modifying factor protein [Myxococcaceae bacterium]|nr:Sulphatase-modifying factor protein [Myxococcaceae bacterium]
MSANPLRSGLPPRWATAWGDDRYGPFVAFAVAGAEQRMRWVPPGCLEMGSTRIEAGRRRDETRHSVVITRGYWLGDTPVTQALWEAVMRADPARFKGADWPVELVSWEDCSDFVRALNDGVDGLGVRLPTEAEWEYACRAGTTAATWAGALTLTANGTRAKELDSIAWYAANSGNTSHAVRGKAPNPRGLYDMLGNVWEWCSDWHGAYDGRPAVDPTGPSKGATRVIRGGSWEDHPRAVRASVRDALHPRDGRPTVGFRLARGGE